MLERTLAFTMDQSARNWSRAEHAEAQLQRVSAELMRIHLAEERDLAMPQAG